MKTAAQPVANSIVERLVAAIGIDRSALDPARLRWIVAARCRLLGLADSSAYAAYLEAMPPELDALIDEVVVQETRFFRDPVVFEHLRMAIAGLAASVTGTLRVLSAPCGTGQEAYSVAALMRTLGVSAARYTIDAFDISLGALEIARRGVYPERALSHVAEELRGACGVVSGHSLQVHDELRERVRFERRNLAAAGALDGAEPYHLILCRNLFIYLGAEARAALAQSLAGALAPGGRLFLGTADRVEELSALFAPMRPAASFAYVRRVEAPVTAAEPRRKARRKIAAEAHVAAPAPVRPPAARLPASKTAPATATELYHRALEHRLRGEIAKAERRCRQSLYLAPNYLPALELLQTLWDQNPNMRMRRALRERILRNSEATA
jgi:chemotaxis methyl-accepting protein methylase